MKSRFAKRLMKDLEENIYCRLQPSRIHCIGVFAIRNIPKGRELFKNYTNYQLTPVSITAIKENKKIDPAVKKFADDVSPAHKGMLYLCRQGLNAIDISFYLNHSNKPNVATKDDSWSFFAARNIKKGEELFSDYETYAENPLA
jgi:SET domain-containing protein